LKIIIDAHSNGSATIFLQQIWDAGRCGVIEAHSEREKFAFYWDKEMMFVQSGEDA